MRTLYNRDDLGKCFGLAVATMLVGQILLTVVFTPIIDPETNNMPDWAFWLMQAVYTLLIGSVTFVYAKITKTDIVSATGLGKKPPLAHIGWGCLATLFLISLMLPVNEWLMDLIEKLGLARPDVEMPMQVVPMVLVACILPAFTEELVFRGTLANSVKNNKNKLAALAISGALFSLFHLNPAQTVHQFVLGGMLALLLFRSGSVWTTVIVHLFNNLIAVVLSFVLPDTIMKYDYVLAIVGLLGFVGCMFGYLKTTKSSWQQEEQQPTSHNSRVFLILSVCVCVFLWVLSLFTKQ